ncbi:MAG: hypothetical protein ABC536_04155 [Candidatus Methanosuratincola petrocarbonis]
MPFRYVIKWRRSNPESVSVEAYHRFPHTESEKRKPAFVIGRAEGARILVIRHLLEKAKESFPTRRYQKTLHIMLEESSPAAYEVAYRIGLAVALISQAETEEEIRRFARYVENVMPEEVWFWTSKLLDDETGTNALDALAVLILSNRDSNAKISEIHKKVTAPALSKI